MILLLLLCDDDDDDDDGDDDWLSCHVTELLITDLSNRLVAG